MPSLFTLILLFIAAIFLTLLVTVSRQVQRLKKELSTYQELAEHLQIRYDNLRAKVEADEKRQIRIHAEYYVQESDRLKYETPKKMDKAIRTKLAMSIGKDLSKKLSDYMTIGTLPDGSEKYICIFTVDPYGSQ